MWETRPKSVPDNVQYSFAQTKLYRRNDRPHVENIPDFPVLGLQLTWVHNLRKSPCGRQLLSEYWQGRIKRDTFAFCFFKEMFLLFVLRKIEAGHQVTNIRPYTGMQAIKTASCGGFKRLLASESDLCVTAVILRCV